MDEFLLNRELPMEDPELAAEAQAAIERDKLDPRQQMYMYNKVTHKLIRTTAEYHRAMENRQEIKLVTYQQAEAIYKQEEAIKKQAFAKVTKRKAAKAARKKNRK